ncbi:MAG: PASTA domain-containing protein [Ignavibacteriae bacterium]|nr:MAG: PASTA domain-containing protein [Ignavibacteriota bacterium]
MTELKRNNNTANTGRRISFFIIVFLLLLTVVLGKLFSIQIINSYKYQLAAKKQYESKISLKPTRGLILDRKLNALISNVNSFSFAADPNMVDNKDSVAELFSRVFQKDKSYYLDKLNTNNTSFVWLERRVESTYEQQLQNLNLSGVIKLNESHRTYNYNELGTQVIGSTDIDNNGISGIEMECNDMLEGKEGYVVMQKDGLGRKRPAIEYPRLEPQNGNNVVLTLDMNVQKVVEEELKQGVTINDAEGGKCVVMSVKTGEVLGMNSVINNIEKGDVRPDLYKLAFLTDLYEPGSTFKVVSAAASLEEGLENKNDVIQTYGGEYQLYDNVSIKDSHKSSNMSFQQVIEQSSNIGMIQVAQKLGKERFYKYARDFGFGISTGIDLPGEMRGYLKKPVDFSAVSLGFMAIGYELMVTAIQMANAYSCIANDGLLMKPYVIKKEMAPDGTVIKEHHPTPIRNVVSKTTAKTLTELFVGAVEKGTGTEAKIENMKIAGKTGTSQKLIEGEYSKRSYTSSFIGYFPADDPQIVIAVIIDAPRSGEYYGGRVAAPIFRKIAERIIAITGVMDITHPEYDENNADIKLANNKLIENPDKDKINIIDFEISDAIRLLKENNIDYEIDGAKKNAIVTDQQIVYGDNSSIKKIKLSTKSITEQGNERLKQNAPVYMPEVKGMSVRKCIKMLSMMGIEYKINGFGRVTDQEPEAGAKLTKNQQVVINCISN